MSSPGFLWCMPRRLGAVKFLLLVLWVSGTLQDLVLFDTGNRGISLDDDSNPNGPWSGYFVTNSSFQYVGKEYNAVGVSSLGQIYFGTGRTLSLRGIFTAAAPLLQANLVGGVKYLEIPITKTDELLSVLDTALAEFLTGLFVEWFFVVTWRNVTPFMSQEERNSFQIVFAVTGEKTFAILNYESIGYAGSLIRPPGFTDGNSSTEFNLPVTEPINLDTESNVGVNGRWIYDVTDFLPGVNGGVPCDRSPCKNNGTCAEEQCTCPLGYGGTTCEEKLSEVRCDSTSMTVVLDQRLLPEGSEPSSVHFLSQENDCVAYVYDTFKIEMSTTYDRCGTTIKEDEDNIIFQNVITFAKPGAGDTGAIITREYHQQILVECCLNKVSVLTGNFKPQIGKIDINDKEHGKFTLKITRFTNDEFDTEEMVNVEDGRVMLGTKLYFGVVLDSTSVVGVVIKECWATEEGPDHDPKEDLIKDQCPAEDTVTVNHALPLDREGFSFDAFRFVNEFSGVAEIYVYCDVVVCKSDEAEAARADVVCGEAEPGVRRRDVSSGTRHTISYGPLNIYSLDASYAASSKESHGMFGTRVYVMGIVALVSMVTIWGVVKGCSFKIKDHEAKHALLVNIN
eukprot:XP_011681362.1 PREDICTED: uncharacterized protein LOC593588 isoform X2 [Strongylocentrotus purpuratus]